MSAPEYSHLIDLRQITDAPLVLARIRELERTLAVPAAESYGPRP